MQFISRPTVRRWSLGLLAVLLLLPAFAHADPSPEPTAAPADAMEPAIEATAEPAKEIPFGASLGYDDAWRAERERAQKALNSAKAGGIYVADMANGYVYFQRNEHRQYTPASTSKIMTALLTIENADMDDIAVAPYEATILGGTNSLLGLKRNEPMAVIDLLYGMMMRSGNDAAVTLAVHISGTEPAFAELMNARAAEIGMKDTYFSNAAGKNAGGNISTAYDMWVLAQTAMQNELFRKVVSTVEYTIPASEKRSKPLTIKNENRMISDKPGTGCYYEYAVGVKPGATALGHTLVSAAKKEDVTILCSQLGLTMNKSNRERAEELQKQSIKFFNTIFNYEYGYAKAAELVPLYTGTVSVENFRITDPENGMLTVHVEPADATAFRPIREIDALSLGGATFTVEPQFDPLTAPIEAGQQVGTVTYAYNGRDWFTLPLLADRSVEAFDPADLITPSPTPSPVPTDTPSPVPTAVPTAVPTEVPMPVPANAAEAEPFDLSQWIVPAVGALIAGGAVVWMRRRRKY